MRTSRILALGSVCVAAGLAAVLVLSAGASASPGARHRSLALSPTSSGAPARLAAPAVPVSVAAGTAQRTFVSAGSGSDANPCTRTAPCRNFAAAIAQTSPGGEVIALDSGGYGPVTIGSAISLIASPGVYAGITAFSGNAITISAGSSDVVVLRGLTLTGLGAQNGLAINSAGNVYVEDLVIKGFSGYGIFTGVTTTGAKLVVSNTRVANAGSSGILLSSSAPPFKVTIEDSSVRNSEFGIESSSNATVTIRDTTVSGNSVTGFASNSGAVVNIEDSLTTENQFGIASGTTIRVSQTTIESNDNGVCGCGAATISFGNNRLAGNTTDGSFSSTIGLQ